MIKALTELEVTLSVVSISDTNQARDVKYLFTPCGKWRYLRKTIFIWNALWQAIRFKPDILICGHINFSFIALILKGIIRLPFFTITHGVEAWELRGLNFLGLKNSDKIKARRPYYNNGL